MARIVVALGGNALSLDGKATAEAQQNVADITAGQLVKLIQAGHEVVVVHGNGPQIGNIILHEEAINTEKTPTMPIDVCVAMSQGQIGYWLQNSLRNILKTNGINRPVGSIVTQVLVDPNDPAFQNPSKPIGPFYTEAEARQLAAERGFVVKPDANRGWRKVVASPQPIGIVESDLINLALDNHAIIIAAGGGGIPVYQDANRLVGKEAVIDKDFAAAKLADLVSADLLLILTVVDTVKLNFGQPNETAVRSMTTEQAQAYISQQQFAPGSMLPKIEASMQFVQNPAPRAAVITSPNQIIDAIQGRSGTIITR